MRNVLPALFFYGTAILAGVFAYIAIKPDPLICVRYVDRLVPIYGQGVKHHMQGPVVGYKEAKQCVETETAKKHKFSFPRPVY